MYYHFKIYEENSGFWAECIELDGCNSEGDTLPELKKNLNEALSLYLDEPPGTNMTFPLPDDSVFKTADLISIPVDPKQALSILLRSYRISKRMTQASFQEKLGMKNRNSYVRLEQNSNPSLETLNLIKTTFIDFPMEKVFSVF